MSEDISENVDNKAVAPPAIRLGTGRNLPPVETRFKKGVSGNPSGRPKVKIVTDAIRGELGKVLEDGRTNAQAIAERLVTMAKAGDVMAIRECVDRTEGKAKGFLEMSTSMQEKTDEALDAEIAAAVLELGYVKREGE